jgi:hypothetical protein
MSFLKPVFAFWAVFFVKHAIFWRDSANTTVYHINWHLLTRLLWLSFYLFLFFIFLILLSLLIVRFLLLLIATLALFLLLIPLLHLFLMFLWAPCFLFFFWVWTSSCLNFRLSISRGLWLNSSCGTTIEECLSFLLFLLSLHTLLIENTWQRCLLVLFTLFLASGSLEIWWRV